MFRAVHGEEFVHDVGTPVWRPNHASARKRTFDVEGHSHNMLQGTAESLEVGLDVTQDGAVLGGDVSNGTTPTFELVNRVVVGSCGRIARKKNKAPCSGNNRGLTPRHETLTLVLLVGHKFHLRPLAGLEMSPMTLCASAMCACIPVAEHRLDRRMES